MNEFFKTYHPDNLFKTKTAFLIVLPLSALAALIYHFKYETYSSTLLVGMIIMYAINIFTISAGYHRYFSHRTYKTNQFIKGLFLFFGASTVENSALLWASDHREHHKHEDTEKDPYNIKRGFFFAHIGWIMLKGYKVPPLAKDLEDDKLIWLQHKYYWPLMFISNLIPFFIAYAITGALVGSFAFVVLLRLVLVHHVTYFINSYCHTFGYKPYNDEITAVDSNLISLITFGESYHNFHHAYQGDYRNGYRWYNIDMTKWILFVGEKLGLVWDLKRAPDALVLASMMKMKQKRKASKYDEFSDEMAHKLELLKEKALSHKRALAKLKKEYKMMTKMELDEAAKAKIEQIKKEIKQMQINFKFAYNEWLNYLKYTPSFA